MDFPFLNSNRTEAPDHPNGVAWLIIALHAAALILFIVSPLAGVVTLAIGSAVAIGVGRPMPVLLLCVGMLWINQPLSDFFPLQTYTAWKDVLLVLVILGWMTRNIVWRRATVINHPISIPLLLFVLTFLASCVLSPSITHAVLGLKATVFYASWYFVLPDIVKSRKDLRNLVGAVCFGTVSMAIYNMWAVQQRFGVFPPGRDGRILPGALVVHWGASNELLPLGILLALVIAPHLALWKRIALDAIVVLGTAGLLATAARASWGVLIGTVIVMSIASRRIGFARLLIVALIAGGVLQSTLALKVTERASSAFEGNDVSAEERETEFSTVTLPFVLSHPFGAGTGSMSAKGSAKVWGGGGGVDLILQKGFIHNGFLLVAIEVGWLGLAFYLWMLGAAVSSAYKVFKTARDPLIRDSALACGGIVVFYALLHFAAPMLTTALISFDIWIILGLIVILPKLDQPPHELPA